MGIAPATIRSRQSLIRAALMAAACVAGVQTVTAQEAPPDRRIRSSNAAIVDALARGVDRSATFRRLVATIDATDGLVFVEEGRCKRSGARACLLMSVTIAGPNRLLRIFVDLRKTPGCELTEALGHELQHAVEVLRQRTIRNELQAYNFFHQMGNAVSGRFETDDAMEAGLAVSREACRGH